MLNPNALPCSNTWYVHLIGRSGSRDWLKKTTAAQQAFDHSFKTWDKKTVYELTLIDGTHLQIWRVNRKRNND